MNLDTLSALFRKPRLRTMALVATVMATVFLMWQREEVDELGGDATELRGPSEPDSFVVEGRYTTWDEQGNLKMTLASPRIEQFDDSDHATMNTPRARIYSAQGVDPWIIEADEGSLQQNEDWVTLTGNVVVLRQTADSEATLTTQSLTLDNQQGIVHTDQPVTITEPFGVTRATGMKAWVDQRILELNSRVEGQYETIR
ncbi:MAG: lipopolysaccharide export system protein LptC [Marinobacter excellens HL-55]|uniref:Lipopolysaccharide export system protein LptC n=1 Tax=Marinobacter excellens HL-55 TaxID=1305731 RepID=A0A0P7Z124_9GAMM|nr:MAG: lipopolysaccharide export system protein LptC [Marinobacter excellens HL-55]